MKEVPVIQYSDMTEEQKEEYRLLDNIISEKAKDNLKNIEVILQKLNNPVLNEMYAEKDINLEMLDVELNKEDEDTVPELTPNPIVKYGDIFQLGEHRLMCGDATNEDDLNKLTDNQLMDMIFTDPPYNVNYKGRGRKTSKGIKNDNMSTSAFLDFLNDSFKNMRRKIKDTGASYVFHSHTTQREFQDALEAQGFEVIKQLIRNKP
jgi:site-specific DNA-methyltransferase (adenine-specific)